MTDANPGKEFAKQLLQQDAALQSSRYQEHRMQLEQQLKRAERNEKRVYWVVVGAAVIAGCGFLLKASNTLGGFDPWDQDATALSVTVGVVLAMALIIFWYGLLAYYGRFRLVTKDVKEKLIFESIRELQREVGELRKLMETSKDRQQP